MNCFRQRCRAAAPVVLGAAGILLFSTTICTAELQRRYTDPEYGYSISAPRGWSRKTDMARPYVAFLGPEDNGSLPNFHIFTEPAVNKTLAEYVRVSRESIAKNRSMRLQSQQRTALCGAPAAVLQSIVTADGRPPMIVRQVVTVHEGRGYVVTLTAPPAGLKRYLPLFGKALASFQWRRTTIRKAS